jgi:O-antigen biosynthesis protein
VVVIGASPGADSGALTRWTNEPPLYAQWELLLPSAPSAEPVIDERIRRIDCGGSADANNQFNSLLQHARGEYLVVVRDHDILPRHALLLIAEAVTHFPNAALVYGDEDRMTPDGHRHAPRFKCDWNLELMRSVDYLDGAVALQLSTVKRLGGLLASMKEAALYDLALRIAEASTPADIVHVPHVLYHRHDTGGAAAAPASPPSREQIAAVQAHLNRCGVNGRAQASAEGGVHVCYAVPDPPPLVSIIIPTRDGIELLRQCVSSILALTEYRNYEVVIVDNGSEEPATLAYLRAIAADARVRVHRDDRPFNYSALNNAALPQCRGSLLALLNNDIEVIDPGWLGEMVSVALQPGVGAVGARLWYPDDTLQHAGVVLGIGGVAGHVNRRLARSEFGYMARDHLRQEFSAVTAACLVIRRAIFEQLRGLDEIHLAVDFNDIDFCLRVGSAGYRNVWTPFANLYHHESATRGTDRSPKGKQRYDAETAYMQSTWAALLANDPAYNPNLTLGGARFEVSDRPRVDLLRPWYEAGAAQRPVP